jgi:hypothetical protein
VWCNPPYSFEAWTWLEKLADHGNGIALIFARTETAGFVRTVWERATAVRFLHGRIHFHYPDGTRAAANSGAPSVLVAYGEYAAQRLEQSIMPGTFIRISADIDPDMERADRFHENDTEADLDFGPTPSGGDDV